MATMAFGQGRPLVASRPEGMSRARVKDCLPLLALCTSSRASSLSSPEKPVPSRPSTRISQCPSNSSAGRNSTPQALASARCCAASPLYVSRAFVWKTTGQAPWSSSWRERQAASPPLLPAPMRRWQTLPRTSGTWERSTLSAPWAALSMSAKPESPSSTANASHWRISCTVVTGSRPVTRSRAKILGCLLTFAPASSAFLLPDKPAGSSSCVFFRLKNMSSSLLAALVAAPQKKFHVKDYSMTTKARA